MLNNSSQFAQLVSGPALVYSPTGWLQSSHAPVRSILTSRGIYLTLQEVRKKGSGKLFTASQPHTREGITHSQVILIEFPCHLYDSDSCSN